MCTAHYCQLSLDQMHSIRTLYGVYLLHRTILKTQDAKYIANHNNK